MPLSAQINLNNVDIVVAFGFFPPRFLPRLMLIRRAKLFSDVLLTLLIFTRLREEAPKATDSIGFNVDFKEALRLSWINKLQSSSIYIIKDYRWLVKEL